MPVELTYADHRKGYMHDKCFERRQMSGPRGIDAFLRWPPENMPADAKCDICEQPMIVAHPLVCVGFTFGNY